jgi:diguanylate cyclase (GGDEF)-like protein
MNSRFKLRNIKTSSKITGAFVIVCCFLLLLGVTGIWTTASIKSRVSDIANQDIPKITWLTESQRASSNTERDFLQAILEPDKQLFRLQMDQAATDQQALQNAFAHYEALPHTPEEEQKIPDARRILQIWNGTLESMRQNAVFGSDASKTQIVDTINNVWQAQLVALNLTLNQLSDIVGSQASNEDDITMQIYVRMVLMLCSGILIAFTLAIGMGIYLSRHIARPLVQMVAVTNRVAHGHLDAIDELLTRYHGTDEMGQFLVAFNTMLAGLRTLISHVSETSRSVSTLSASLDDSFQLATEDATEGNALVQATRQMELVDQLNRQLAQAYQELAVSHENLEIANQTIQKQALTDPLTGLPNHRALIDQLQQEVQRAELHNHSFGVIFFDGDRFKRVNDVYGHAAGDAVLRQLGERAQSVLRSSDTLGRYGGEEFIALLPEVDAIEAMTIAERMREAVEAFPLAQEMVKGGLPITISIGVAIYPTDATTSSELLIKADQAMYWAKKSGRNRVCTVNEAQAIGNSVQVKASNEDDERLRDTLLDPEQLRRYIQLLHSYIGNVLTSTLSIYDNELAEHSERVSRYSAAIAREMQLDPSMIDRITIAASLHDIGKIGIPPALLKKQSLLSDDERQIVQQHPALAAQILITTPLMHTLLPAVRHHHERWDGTGYPQGLQGEMIPLEARIIAIADAYDAIRTERSYKKGQCATEAIAELEKSAGTHFDPALIVTAIHALQQVEQQRELDEAA